MDTTFGRPEIIDTVVQTAFIELHKELERRLKQHGKGILVSNHEILGVMAEEHLELEFAVKGNNNDQVRSELMDIAVGAIFSWASSIQVEEKACL